MPVRPTQTNPRVEAALFFLLDFESIHPSLGVQLAELLFSVPQPLLTNWFDRFRKLAETVSE